MWFDEFLENTSLLVCFCLSVELFWQFFCWLCDCVILKVIKTVACLVRRGNEPSQKFIKLFKRNVHNSFIQIEGIVCPSGFFAYFTSSAELNMTNWAERIRSASKANNEANMWLALGKIAVILHSVWLTKASLHSDFKTILILVKSYSSWVLKGDICMCIRAVECSLKCTIG